LVVFFETLISCPQALAIVFSLERVAASILLCRFQIDLKRKETQQATKVSCILKRVVADDVVENLHIDLIQS
jgi:hypothetical protein